MADLIVQEAVTNRTKISYKIVFKTCEPTGDLTILQRFSNPYLVRREHLFPHPASHSPLAQAPQSSRHITLTLYITFPAKWSFFGVTWLGCLSSCLVLERSVRPRVRAF